MYWNFYLPDRINNNQLIRKIPGENQFLNGSVFSIIAAVRDFLHGLIPMFFCFYLVNASPIIIPEPGCFGRTMIDELTNALIGII
jgi:hypothetical protein